MSAKESGKANDFELVGDTAAGYNVLKTLGLNTAEADVKEEIRKYNDFKAQVSEWEVKRAANQEVIDAYNDKKTEYEERLAADGLTEEEKAAIQEELTKLTEDYDKAVADNADLDAKITANQDAMAANPYRDIAELDGEAQAQAIKNAAANITDGAVKIEGKDAEIKLNGVTYTSTSNSFSINGLTIEVTGVTNEKGDGKDADKAVSITTTTDTQGIYDKIKDFLTEYNNVINEITKLYNAESASDYQPLTDEEKDAMSDEQIEKWENKIKSALLRRDSSLSSIMNAMVNSMAQTVDVDGEKLSLSNFGIQTLGFLNAAKDENYAYHINGDEDDENTSGKEDKLMKAIQENPDQICAFMKKLTSNLYTAIDNKMKSTELSSAYKVYNDKELDSQLTKYKQLITNWEKKVSAQEEAYYKKFSQMEVALSKLQNQTNALSGLFGQ